MPEVPRLEPLVRDPGERQPRESPHGKPRRFAQAVNLPVLAFPEHDAQRRRAPLDAEPRHLGGPRRLAVDDDARAPARQVRVFDDPLHLGEVHLGRFLARVQQAEREVTVVGEEQRPGGAEVEAPHGDHAGPDAAHVFRHRGTSGRVRHGADDVPGLVKHQVHLGLADHGASIDLDATAGGIRLGSELGHDVTVHLHSSGGDQLLGLSSGGDATTGQDLLQAFACHGRAALPESGPVRYSTGTAGLVSVLVTH
jgi:hypothetical protein